MSEPNNFTIDAGARLVKTFVYENPNGTVVNLTGYTATFQIRKSTFGPLITSATPAINASTYVITLTLTPEQTLLLRDSNYVYAIQVSNASTGDVKIASHGALTINQAIVR
jgi:hypothetical protein